MSRTERHLRDIVIKATAPVHHVCGMAKIGSRTDPNAVVDPDCRVYGIQGLRVADASVMPSIVSANTNLTVLMIAEKVADRLVRDRGETFNP